MAFKYWEGLRDAGNGCVWRRMGLDAEGGVSGGRADKVGVNKGK